MSSRNRCLGCPRRCVTFLERDLQIRRHSIVERYERGSRCQVCLTIFNRSPHERDFKALTSCTLRPDYRSRRLDPTLFQYCRPFVKRTRHLRFLSGEPRFPNENRNLEGLPPFIIIPSLPSRTHSNTLTAHPSRSTSP